MAMVLWNAIVKRFIAWCHRPKRIIIANSPETWGDGQIDYNRWYVVWVCGKGQYGSMVMGCTAKQAYMNLCVNLPEYRWPPFKQIKVLEMDYTCD